MPSEGCIVTIDATGCQTGIAETIQEAGADYVSCVKENQEGLRSDVERVFDRCREQGFEPGTTDVDSGHGQALACRCWIVEVSDRDLIARDR